MKIKWAENLSSKKFWGLLIVLIAMNLALFGVNQDVVVKLCAILTQMASLIIYIMTQGEIDKANALNPPVTPAPEITPVTPVIPESPSVTPEQDPRV